MPIPESTSAEAYESYIGGKCLRACRGEAWRDIKACIIASPRTVDNVHLPGDSEAFIAWTMSGQAEFQERQSEGAWITHQIRTGSLLLTTDWTAQHMYEELGLDRLASHAGLSKFHFLRLFKNATGEPPSRYHTSLRMDAARRMLRETKKSVVEIALDVGYTNPSHFAKL